MYETAFFSNNKTKALTNLFRFSAFLQVQKKPVAVNNQGL